MLIRSLCVFSRNARLGKNPLLQWEGKDKPLMNVTRDCGPSKLTVLLLALPDPINLSFRQVYLVPVLKLAGDLIELIGAEDWQNMSLTWLFDMDLKHYIPKKSFFHSQIKHAFLKINGKGGIWTRVKS